MTPDHWNSGSLAVAMWLNGAALVDTDGNGTPLTDDTFLVLFNASWNPQVFTLPPSSPGTTWMPVLDTTESTGLPLPSSIALPAASACTLSPRGLLVLRRQQ
jgi:isoamylase